MEQVLAHLKALAELTRLRIVALCARSDLSVSDLTQILDQSQPRVSRHLKLLVEGGLLERHREGSFAFFRLNRGAEAPAVLPALLGALPETDPQLKADRSRLETVLAARAARAAAYFAENADQWDELRRHYVHEEVVEAELINLIKAKPVQTLLDIGTGTGRILQVLGPLVESALGVDQSSEMLAVARAALDRDGLNHATVRQGSFYALPGDGAFDMAVAHQVLHYAETPDLVIAEAARVLAPGGRLVVVDFKEHDLDALREDHAHRWLGFGVEEVETWCRAAGLIPNKPKTLAGDPLTVLIWVAEKPAS
ncbi:MAG: ArsR/SmtB family transcription factor [Magnetovibrionaceae bacterium]